MSEFSDSLPLLYFYFAGIALYFVCDLFASIIAGKKHGWKYLIPLSVMFFCVHVSYGVGTIKGLIAGLVKK